MEELNLGIVESLSQTSLEKDGPEGKGLDNCYVFVGTRENPPTGGSTEMGELRLRLAEKLKEKGES